MAGIRGVAFAACLLCMPLRAPAAGTFTNPIGPGADPWVIRHQGAYYLIQGRSGGIYVGKSARLEEVASAPRVRVWQAPDSGAYSKEIWAPELHLLDGKWYVYFAADDGDNANHRPFVLEGTSADPLDPFVLKGRIAAPTDRWGIDATVLEARGKRYLVWSGWEGAENIHQDLYIAPLANPWTLGGDRARISTPEYAWEKNGGPPAVNEGPEALYHGGDVFLIYSASGTWTDDYCLGQLRLVGSDPMDPQAWKKSATPVFAKTEQVFGPGHGSFVKSPDGSEDWIVYHANPVSGSGSNRNIRMQRFDWNPDGTPAFGTPVPAGVALEAPSDESIGIRKPVRHHAPAPSRGSYRGRDLIGKALP